DRAGAGGAIQERGSERRDRVPRGDGTTEPGRRSSGGGSMTGPHVLNQPTTLLAEITYRCPLHCPYCSNPLEMTRAEAELSTSDWKRVFTEARNLGVLQLGLCDGGDAGVHEAGGVVVDR